MAKKKKSKSKLNSPQKKKKKEEEVVKDTEVDHPDTPAQHPEEPVPEVEEDPQEQEDTTVDVLETPDEQTTELLSELETSPHEDHTETNAEHNSEAEEPATEAEDDAEKTVDPSGEDKEKTESHEETVELPEEQTAESADEETNPLAESSRQLDEEQTGEPVSQPMEVTESRDEQEVTQEQPQAEPEPQEQTQPEPPVVGKLISSTPGPYSLSTLNIDIPPSMGTLSAICHHESNVYIGTSLGYILTYATLPDGTHTEHVLISQEAFHSTRQYPITHFLPLPTLQILLAVSGSLLQCFSMPTPTPLAIGRIKDVTAIELDLSGRAKCDENGVHVVVMTRSQIRVVNVTKQALRLVKDIKLGVKCGKRRGDKLVVAHDQYEIVDLVRELNNRVPLFPVNTSGEDALTPFVEGVGQNEFLLVCGTGKEDPAMGMVVNLKGDVSRGTIPMMKYPDQVLTDKDIAFAVTGDEIKAYSLDDQREVQSWSFSKDVMLTRVDPMEVQVEGLVELIVLKAVCGGDDERQQKELEFARKIAQVNSSVVCYCEDFVELLVPQSRLEKLKEVSDLKVLEKELASSQATTELTVIEVEYLNLQISLFRLLYHRYDEALESWTNGTLDPRILIYAFDYEVKGSVYIFAGLHPLLNKVKSTIKDTAFRTFFELFLERWITKHSLENMDIIQTLEHTSLLYHLDNHIELLQTLKNINNIDVLPILEENKKHLALATIYAETDPIRALNIHKDLVDNKIYDPGFDKSDSLHIICELGNKCTGDERRETGMWLLQHDARLGISFMNSSKISLHSLHTGLNRREEVKKVLETIDDVALKYEYVSQVFVSMNEEKMRLGLRKGLYKSLLKSLTTTERKLREVQRS